MSGSWANFSCIGGSAELGPNLMETYQLVIDEALGKRALTYGKLLQVGNMLL